MSTSRYIPHSNKPPSDLGVVQEDIQDALASHVRRVHRHTAARNGVYIGSAGVYVMDKSVAGFIPSDLPTSSITLLMSKQLSIPPSGSRASFLETSVGPATLILKERIWVGSDARSASVSKSDLQKLEEFWQPCAQLLESAIQVSVSEEIDDDGCEVLYGRAGLLYALLLLRTALASLRDGGMSISQTEDPAVRAVTSLCSDANVQALVDDIMKRGKIGAREYQEELASLRDERDKVPPLMWRWHVSRYLGGAHGVVGILHMLVMAPSNITTTYWPDIVGMVEWLLAIQEPLGNWPSKAGRHLYYVAGGTATSQEAKRVSVGKDNQHELLQWCHGAPGVLILLSAFLNRTAQSSSLTITSSLRDRTIAAMQRGGELVYTHGLLRKGVGLCHGVAGSVYALLAVSDALDSRENTYWLLRAVHLAHLATEYGALERKGETRVPDEPYSLYEGIAGMCCAWAEVLVRLGVPSRGVEKRKSGMPGYDDL
ncbi:uncharacterized protein C8Q71DRAFT_706445 [Rhodofomes roseus]|uniref:Lanthionine synthetase-like protein n=1 Tax=Rhodofomes roseus TaxID=34475 RepID=A0ABQ8KKJ5_9APHY|nr:uncharacterized protein C8Q71DRAFT_706445 [Rhodofomes roseus]KAH9838013.1 hypothetical protein C8Q71DRAFT_706445 [Rhodofomes roseus]